MDTQDANTPDASGEEAQRMNALLLRNLYSCFHIHRRSCIRDLTAPHFRVFDHDGYVPNFWSEVDSAQLGPMDDIVQRQHTHRYVWPKTIVCEAYVYSGETDQLIVVELRNVYLECRDEIEQFVRSAGGCVEQLMKTWLARLELPLTQDGAQVMCQLADIVECCRRRSSRNRHYMRTLAVSLRKVASAITLTAGAVTGVAHLPVLSQRTSPKVIGTDRLKKLSK